MEKEYYQNIDKKNNSKKIITGATKAVACVAATSLIVGSIGLRLASLECAANHSLDTICPMTKIKTALFGVEAGMEHQAQDIEKINHYYSDRREYTEDVSYYPAGSYVAPVGFQLGVDENGQMIAYREVPLEQGETVETVMPTYIENDTIYYTVVVEGEDGKLMERQIWVYDGENYTHEDVASVTKAKTK